MIIKKYQGKTEEEAIALAKKELGDGVVIMNVRNVKKKGLLGLLGAKCIEVTVALEAEKEVIRQPKRDVAKETFKLDNAEVKPNEGMSSHGLMQESSAAIEKKLDSLETLLVSQMQKAEEERELAKKEREKEEVERNKEVEQVEEDSEQEKFIRLLYNTMINGEVDQKYANQILQDIESSKKPNVPFDYILANVYQKMILKFGMSDGILPAEEGPKVVAFIGPTGVGKTTTIAKVASHYAVEEKKKIALLTADTYRIAAAEQLRTYANILEVPFRVIYTEDELQSAVADFREYDYIFLDTIGHSYQNEEQIMGMKNILKAMEEVAETQVFLVLSATTKYRDLLKIVETYNEIAKYQLIFTKLDETDTLGNLLNLKLYTDSEIAYVTCGQNVPSDIEKFNPQKTVKQLLGGKN